MFIYFRATERKALFYIQRLWFHFWLDLFWAHHLCPFPQNNFKAFSVFNIEYRPLKEYDIIIFP